VGSRSSRIVVPAIGLFVAVVAALALVAFAPVVLLPGGNDVGPLPGAPNASREVARVTAPALRPSHGRTRPAAGETAGSQDTGATGSVPTTNTGTAGTVAAAGASKPGDRPVFRGGGSLGEEPAGPKGEEPGKSRDEDKGNGKAKGHHKAKHHGNAKGHSKSEHHETKGHSKSKHHARIAFAAPRAAKSCHVHPSRSGKHAGRRTRPHARAWR
jgi:hypothetical protein